MSYKFTKRDLSTIGAEDARAQLNGLIGSDGTRYGSADGHRSLIEAPRTSRRRCNCGCAKRATHTGLGDGLALTMGCELSIRRWVRDGYTKPAEGTPTETRKES